MVTKIFNGKKVAEKIYKNLSKEIRELKRKHKINPKLAVILIGDNPASETYIRIKEKACKKLGIISKVHRLTKAVKEIEVLDLINKLNKDKTVHGILVQFPLPKNLNKKRIMRAIFQKKDVDGFNPENIGRVMLGDEKLAPCTPKAIIKILDDSKICLKGKEVIIINHSNIIGKPLSLMLLNRNATVSICHKYTKDLKEYTQKADIIITAVGLPGLIKQEMVKKGVVVIDGGITKRRGRIYGDVDFEKVKTKVSFLTPVPGGLGLITVTMLMQNTIFCYKNSLK